jgi:hypothetical protein
VFFNLDRGRIADPAFLKTKAFEGAQLKYTWRELEPGEGAYDFRAVRHDLRFLRSKGKRLFLQLQDVSFDNSIVNVPGYLRTDPRYHGGADPQYVYEGDDDSKAVPAGWVARRWDPAVRERFARLLTALGRVFDGRIEGINLPETAVDFGGSGRWYPKWFTPAGYRDAVLANMAALKRAFPRSVTLQYANFMPGEWLPEQDRSYLRSVYRRAKDLKVGVGGPDLLPNKPGQMKHTYRMMREFGGGVPTGIAVQWGNYEHVNPKTGKRVTVPELLRFATEYLHCDYVFWCTQEPYYTKDLIPFLKTRAAAFRPVPPPAQVKPRPILLRKQGGQGRALPR